MNIKCFTLIGILAILLVLATPTMAASVPGVWIGGNPTCAELGQMFGYNWIDLKVDPVVSGTYSDGYLTVEIDVSGKSFDWTSNIPVSAVFVKGGPGGTLYNYEEAESLGDTNLISIRDDGKQFGLSHLNFCYDFEVEASKDAETTFTRTWNWDIDKSVDVDQHDLFDGQDGTSNYTVDVDKVDYTDSDWAVSGNIWIHNPAPFAATIEDVEDEVSGVGNATVDCGVVFPYDLASNGDLHCTYSLDLPDGTDRLNTATVTTSGIVNGDTATADVLFGDPTTVVYDEVNITDTYEGDLGTVDDDHTFMYSRTFTCGEDEGSHPNTATIVETGQSDDESVDVECYRPEVSKTAETSWSQTYEWTIDKSVDVDLHQLFDGQSGTSNYEVEVDLTVTDGDFFVSGEISVYNPHPSASLTVDVADTITGGINPTLDCGGELVVGPGETETCGYSTDLPDNTDRTNNAVVTAFGIDYPANAAVEFGDPTIIGYPTINVDDSYEGDLGSTDDDHTFTYSRTFTCGEDEGSHPNTATIVETGQSDDESVDVECYRPEVSKTAETSWSQTYEWIIDKSVDVDHHQLFDGESGVSNYTVEVDLTVTDGDFFVSGLISVYNPHPTDSLTVDVADTISGGIVPTLDCGGQLVVGPGGTETCGYSSNLPDNTNRTNDAVVTAFGIDYPASADVIFGDPTIIGYPTINVDDSYAGYLGSASDDHTFTYSRTFTCGEDEGSHPNVATIVETGQSDNATVTVECLTPPQWCSPGFWKNHTDVWPIDPNTPYNDVFDPDLEGDPTLYDVISQPEVYGGPLTNDVADYLSALHPDINFTGSREDNCPLS